MASSMPLRVSLVNLQKLTLWWCDDPASIWMLAPAQNTFSRPPVSDDGVDLGVLEAEALDGVGQLDVDGQVVGVELELVVVPQPALGIDVHGQRGHRAVDRQPPVPVLLRRGLEVHGRNGRQAGIPSLTVIPNLRPRPYRPEENVLRQSTVP